MATIPATLESREVLRCERCQLVQYRSASGTCRRCRQSTEPEEAPLPLLLVASPGTEEPSELDVARAVRTLRRTRGLSQRQLAGRMLVPRTYISKIENGKAMPTLSSLGRLADALEAPMTDLLQDGSSRRQQALSGVLADPFVCELMPFAGRLSAFQQQVLLRQARDMARATGGGKQQLARA